MPITLATPTNSQHGAIVTPPSMIRDTIKRKVDEALADIPPGKRGALVAVATEAGVNIAIAHRDPASGWQVAAWVGRNWSGAVSAGAEVKKTW